MSVDENNVSNGAIRVMKKEMVNHPEHYNSGKIPLIHLDLYRLDNISSAKEVFFSEEAEAIQNQAILVIEWPEIIEPLIDNFWKIKISYAKNSGRHYVIRDPKNLLTFS